MTSPRRSPRWSTGLLFIAAFAAIIVVTSLLFGLNGATMWLFLMFPAGFFAAHVSVYLVDRYSRRGRNLAGFAWKWSGSVFMAFCVVVIAVAVTLHALDMQFTLPVKYAGMAILGASIGGPAGANAVLFGQPNRKESARRLPRQSNELLRTPFGRSSRMVRAQEAGRLLKASP